jgi:hypothetical protein
MVCGDNVRAKRTFITVAFDGVVAVGVQLETRLEPQACALYTRALHRDSDALNR